MASIDNVALQEYIKGVYIKEIRTHVYLTVYRKGRIYSGKYGLMDLGLIVCVGSRLANTAIFA